jgi:hypothetical protein
VQISRLQLILKRVGVSTRKEALKWRLQPARHDADRRMGELGQRSRCVPGVIRKVTQRHIEAIRGCRADPLARIWRVFRVCGNKSHPIALTMPAIGNRQRSASQ